MAKVFQILVPDNTLVSRIIGCENQVTELIVFSKDYPRLVSCCFSEVLELDVKEIWLEDGLQFLCEEPETHEQYKLNADDFLLGELRHVIERL